MAETESLSFPSLFDLLHASHSLRGICFALRTALDTLLTLPHSFPSLTLQSGHYWHCFTVGEYGSERER